MQCLYCGADIGDKLGACPECLKKRTESRKVQSVALEDPIGSRNAKSSLKLPLAALSITVGFALIIALWPAFHPERYEVRKDGKEISISVGDNTELHYSIAATGNKTGRVLSFDADAGKQMPRISGGKSVLHFLSNEDYAAYKDVKGCTAGFLNEHTEHIILVSDSKEFERSMGSAGIKEGDEISLDGGPMTFTNGTFEGQEMASPPSGNVSVYYVAAASLNGAELF